MSQSNPNQFEYMLLSRIKQDCDYYLGNGNRHASHLWAQCEVAQIAKMRELFEMLPAKPEWLTADQIDAYETAMLGTPKRQYIFKIRLAKTHPLNAGKIDAGTRFVTVFMTQQEYEDNKRTLVSAAVKEQLGLTHEDEYLCQHAPEVPEDFEAKLLAAIGLKDSLVVCSATYPHSTHNQHYKTVVVDGITCRWDVFGASIANETNRIVKWMPTYQDNPIAALDKFCCGKELASVSSKRNLEDRWTEFTLSRAHNKYLCAKVERTTVQGELNQYSGVIVDTIAEVHEFFGQNDLAKVLYFYANIEK